MIGEMGENEQLDKIYGEILKKYFLEDENLFVFSTDFCHWGEFYDF